MATLCHDSSAQESKANRKQEGADNELRPCPAAARTWLFLRDAREPRSLLCDRVRWVKQWVLIRGQGERRPATLVPQLEKGGAQPRCASLTTSITPRDG